MEQIIIPLGEECYTCQSIDLKFTNNSLRKCGFPFDYVGHTYIENIHDNLVDLLNSNYRCTIDDFSQQSFNDKMYMVHNKYKFKYWHDDSNDCQAFIDKYNRRYERLTHYLKNDYDVILLSVNHFDNIYNKTFKQMSVYKLFDLLKPYNIKFIAINFGEELLNIPNLHFVNLSINYDLPFVESKEEFTKHLYEFINQYFDK